MKIFITGASSGLGAQFAKEYATNDNELILLARREQKLLQLQSMLAPHAKSVEIIVADVCEFKKLQEKIQHLEKIDLVILNAGISLGHTQNMASIEEFKNLYDVNVLANHAILEILIPKMQQEKKGTIVFISSLASLFSMPTSKVYSSSKRALNAYAEGIRYKYAKDGIKVLTLLPGFIKSELTDKNDFDMPFFLSTKKGVKIMKRAIEKGKVFYPFPLRFYLIIMLLKITPRFLRQMIINSLNK
ncbi:MAG: SDR family NAD(P)-dependent oxidoreductase [Sulfurimonadaceae bacterium]|jgi:short-subunit dehydrogenase|nr:SDR family NAD(P)-dependent oxidoreductase [Sulfurimonadaceae bacterium]